MIFKQVEYDDRASWKVVLVLDAAINNRKRLKIVYGDVIDPTKEPIQIVRGMIGRSAGEIKIPLLIKTCRSLGGEALRTSGIIEIREVDPRGKPGKLLYSRLSENKGIAY